jgi:hypothetical protein
VEERVRGEASGGSSEIGQWGRFGRKKRGGWNSVGKLRDGHTKRGFFLDIRVRYLVRLLTLSAANMKTI